MSDHRPPPPPPPPPFPLIHLNSTSQILKKTTAIFSIHHHLLIFTLLSFLILSLRSNVESATHSLTSFIDHDPSIKSLLSRLHISPNPPAVAPNHRYRRRPFLQLTRVGTLDDDFFSGDEDLDHRFFRNIPKTHLNSTNFIIDTFDPNLGFANFISDNGIRVSEIIRSNSQFSFKLVDANEKKGSDRNDYDSIKENETEISEIDDELQVFLKRFELEHHELTALLFLVGVLSFSYGFAILGFVVTYSWVLGIVFVVVVNEFLESYPSLVRTVWNGSNLGLKRLTGLILMRWALRDALTQFLGVWFFGEVEDGYAFFKIFVRLKLMPFSVSSPWVEGFEREVYGFLISWFVLDNLVSFVFTLDSWIAMVDEKKGVGEVVKEGYRLLLMMLNPAINLKCLEGIVCGSFTRWLVSRVFGRLVASGFQSFMEVYFMVAWLVFYLSVKSRDAYSSGTTFGHRELEGLLEDVR